MQRKDTGKYQAYYRDPSGRQRSKDFTRKRDAINWEQQRRQEVTLGTWLDPEQAKVPLSAMYERWLTNKKNSIKVSTLHSYEENFRNLIRPTFGRTPLSHITTPAVLAWQQELVQRVSVSRARRARTILSQVLDLAVVEKRIPANPVTAIPKGLAPKNNQPPRVHLYLDRTQVERLAIAVGAHGTLIRLLAYSGLRWGEAIALRACDIDASRRRVTIARSFSTTGGKPLLTTPKTGVAREVPIPGSLSDALLVAANGRDDYDLIFGDGVHPLDINNFRSRIFRPSVIAAGLDKRLRIHDLRHTAASLAIQRGANSHVVQRMLGHQSAKMTLDVYAGLFESDLDSAFEGFDNEKSATSADSVLTPSAGGGNIVHLMQLRNIVRPGLSLGAA